MPDSSEKHDKKPKGTKQRPFRRAVLRGLGVALPPLLTIVLFLWAWNLIQAYVLEPVEEVAHWAIVNTIWDVHSEEPAGAGDYQQLESKEWIPRHVYDQVRKSPGKSLQQTAQGYFDRYVWIRWLPRWGTIPLFLSLFLLILSMLGRFLAAGMGRLMWATFENLIQRVPIIRNVYSAVKQVTDFVFTERDIEFNRVVAVEYPRKGVWSIGFVTGESMLDIRSSANEPVLSVLMPTSPMPATGFTITVRKSETIDLDITVDQAIQFVVSCGVVVPLQQQHKEDVTGRVTAAIASRTPSEQRSLDLSSAASSGEDDDQDAGDRAMREPA
ncbi:MAG: DUF502 domain-containing protein [Planctomycetes bacterium]|nr:DUF502 domain-containing protein [Planctomycetota bacterium]MBL7041783.1 DUF502 domain-containing protein [Pirellulaceae bacterium]